MTNEDIKELGLPNYEEIQRAFMETDHYNHCHRSGIEWQDGAEWMRGIAIDAIKKKEKELIEKACDAYCKLHCYDEARWMCRNNPISRCTTFEVIKKALEE